MSKCPGPVGVAAVLGMLPLAYDIASGADMLRPLAISDIGAVCIFRAPFPRRHAHGVFPDVGTSRSPDLQDVAPAGMSQATEKNNIANFLNKGRLVGGRQEPRVPRLRAFSPSLIFSLASLNSGCS